MPESPEHPSKRFEPPKDAPRPLSKRMVAAAVAPFAAWLVIMTVLALWPGPPAHGPDMHGWRLMVMRDVSVALFVVAIAAAAVAAIVLEARRRDR